MKKWKKFIGRRITLSSALLMTACGEAARMKGVLEMRNQFLRKHTDDWCKWGGNESERSVR